MDVQREGRLATGQLAHRAVDELVALAARDDVSCQTANGWVPALATRSCIRSRVSWSSSRSDRSSSIAPDTWLWMPVWSSSAEPWVSAVAFAASVGDNVGSTLSIAWASAQECGLEQHHLLLDAERVLGLGPVGGHSAQRGSWIALRWVGRLAATSPRLCRAGALDEGLEQGQLLGPVDEALGVPLDADEEVALGVLDRLDDPVGRPGDGDEAVAEPVHGLVVERVDVDPAAPRISAPTSLPGSISTSWVGCVARPPLAVARSAPVCVGEVLVQRAAAGDVESLGAAADRQDRHPARVGRAGDRQLEAVEVGLGRPELRVARPVVAVRVEVGPAREADARDPVEQRLDRVVAQRRHHHRDAAGPLDRAQVGEPERHLVARRLALGGLLDLLGAAHLGGGDADQRPVSVQVGMSVRACHSITQVSLAPPPRELLTIISPAPRA